MSGFAGPPSTLIKVTVQPLSRITTLGLFKITRDEDHDCGLETVGTRRKAVSTLAAAGFRSDRAPNAPEDEEEDDEEEDEGNAKGMQGVVSVVVSADEEKGTISKSGLVQ